MVHVPMRYILFICLGLSSIFGIASAQEDTSSIPHIAFVQDYSLNVYNPATGNMQTIVPASADPFLYFRAFWSPDGTRLAYLIPDAAPAITSTLYITDMQSEPLALTSFEFTPFDPLWLEDGRILYASYSGERREMIAILNVYAIEPVADAEPELLGSFEVGEGCGGGTSNPAEGEYYFETSLGGYREVFDLTPYGLVHDGQCVGAMITLTNLETGAATRLADGNLVKGVVSPDGNRVLGIHEGQLTLVNLADMSTATIATSTTPDQYIWQDENHIIYSTMTVNGDLLELYSAAQIETIRAAQGGFLPEVMPRFQSSIFSVDLSTGTETQRYTADAYAIGRMAVRGDWLLFSQVENADRWVQGMVDGTVTFESGTLVWDDLVYTGIYALNLLSNAATPLFEDGQHLVVAP
jgi:hypothetical protein